MELYEFLKKRVKEEDGYIKYSHLTITELATGFAKAEAKVDETMLNPMGTIHGGCLFSMCDTVGGTAAMTHGRAVTSTTGMISYFNPAKNGSTLSIKAKELKYGRNLGRYEVYIWDDEGTLICKTDMEYYILGALAH